MRKQEYILKDLEFSGKAFRRNNRKIIKGSTGGLLTLPPRFVNQMFDIILIPVEVDNEAEDGKAP